jgi:hypothetical protein
MRMPVFLVLLFATVLGYYTAEAQTCPRSVTTSVTAAGQVTLSSPNTITRIDFSPNGQTHYRTTQSASPGSVPAFVTPNATSFTFYLTAVNSDTYPTVRIFVTDACGEWETLAGAGPAIFPTSGPTVTRTPVPTPVPTAVPTVTPITPVAIPSSTPQVSVSASFGPKEVLQGNKINISWAGRSNPNVGDFVALANLGGNLAGPPIYTSSCSSTQGATAKSAGNCTLTIGTAFPSGQYLVRLYGNNNSNNLLYTVSTYLDVKSSGTAIFGKGQTWGTLAQWEHPNILAIGGFTGALGYLNAGDPGYNIFGTSYRHVGLSDFGLIGENFIEAGVQKVCAGGAFQYCSAYPYMSWMDNGGVIRQAVWDGNGGFPTASLVQSNDIQFKFAVYETNATVWSADFCDLNEHCCPIWQKGIPCTGMKNNDLIPITLRLRFPWIFGGSETEDVRTPAGFTNVTNYAYCCEIFTTNWTPASCWDYPWDTYDKSVIYTAITGCLGTSSWYTISAWK